MKLSYALKYCLVGLVVIGIMWLCAPVEAKDNHLYTGAWSFHHMTPENGKAYNETNNLVGVQYKNVFLGTFNNSYHNQTHIAGLYFPTPLKDTLIEVSLVAGVAYGYKECFAAGNPQAKTKYCGIVIPEITLNLGRFKPSIIVFGSDIQVVTFKWEF
jgi:hypothetical protein